MKQFFLTWYYDIPRQSHGKIGNKQKKLLLGNLTFFSKDEPHENYFQKDSLSNQLFSKLFQRIFQKQASKGIFKNRCSENMQQIYRITPMRKCDFNKVALQCTI